MNICFGKGCFLRSTATTPVATIPKTNVKSQHFPRWVFSYLSTTDILNWISLSCVGCPVHPGYVAIFWVSTHQILGHSSLLQSYNQKCIQQLLISVGENNHQLRITTPGQTVIPYELGRDSLYTKEFTRLKLIYFSKGPRNMYENGF